MHRIIKFIKNAFVRKWFFTLLAFVMVLFTGFMLYTHYNATKALQLEYTSYSELQTERISAALDDDFVSFSRITSLLSINNMIQIYLFNDNAERLFPDIYSQIYSQLVSYQEGFPAVNSIYLFPSYGSEVFTSSSQNPQMIKSQSDAESLSAWEMPEGNTFIPRKKDNRYPYLMTLCVPLYKSGQQALIAVNIDTAQISTLADGQNTSFQNIYIISDDGDLLYRNGQQDIPEALETVPELIHFDSSKEFYSKYVTGDEPYIYVQQHSGQYDWYYITVTTPQSYIGKGYDFSASLFSLFPWLLVLALLIVIWMVWLITHPVRTIMDFLDNPLTEQPEKISEPETQKIIRHLMKYIQTNHALSKELDKQLEQQNKATYHALQSQINPHFLFNTLNLIRNMEVETLGFDHKAPEMTLTLSRLLQYALDSTNLVTLKTEFYYTELYLKILNQRYKEKLHFTLQSEGASADIMVPKLILQPLIENAVFHGCSPQLDKHNTILVKAETTNNYCNITIQDNGIGMSHEKLEALRNKLKDLKSIPSDSIGLQNVAVRMHLTYGDAFTIHIDSKTGEGTSIMLSIPITGD